MISGKKCLENVVKMSGIVILVVKRKHYKNSQKNNEDHVREDMWGKLYSV